VLFHNESSSPQRRKVREETYKNNFLTALRSLRLCGENDVLDEPQARVSLPG
jgi:hypothetical protein